MLTQRVQITAIIERLKGTLPRFDPSEFDPHWRACYEAIEHAPPGHEKDALLDAIKRQENREELLQAIRETQHASPDFSSLHDIAPDLPPAEWLWEPWIPCQALSMLGAMPGAGKSLFALDLARRIIHGENLPDGTPVKRPGANVIYVDAELAPHITHQRAQAWGLDRSKLYLFPSSPNDLIDFNTLACRNTLVEMCYNLDPALIAVDSLSAVNSKGENSPKSVCEILGFFSNLARTFKTAVFLAHHPRKRRSSHAIYQPVTLDDFRGSSRIIAMVKSIFALHVVRTGPEFDPAGPRKLYLLKTNAGALPTPLGLTLQPLDPTGVALHYGPPPVEYHEPTELELCVGWLIRTLRESAAPMQPGDVIDLGKLTGFSRRTIYRARQRLAGQIVDTARPRSTHNRWALAETLTVNDEQLRQALDQLTIDN